MSARRDGWWRDYSCDNDAKSITLGQLPFQLSTTGNRTLVSSPPLGQDYGVRTCALICIVALIGAAVLSSLGYRDLLFSWVQHVPGGDKTGHVFFMGAVAFFTVWLSVPRLPWRHIRSVVGVLLGLLVLIGLEEWSQVYLPTRTFDLGDLYCGWIGVLLFGSLAGWITRPSADQPQ